MPNEAREGNQSLDQAKQQHKPERDIHLMANYTTHT